MTGRGAEQFEPISPRSRQALGNGPVRRFLKLSLALSGRFVTALVRILAPALESMAVRTGRAGNEAISDVPPFGGGISARRLLRVLGTETSSTPMKPFPSEGSRVSVA